MSTGLRDRARALVNRYQYAKGSPEQQALDTIAELLAENDRLIAERPKVYASGMSDGRNGTPCEAIRMGQEIATSRERAEAAEAHLRDLANAEPVAWAKFDGNEITHMEMSDGSSADFNLVGCGFVPLIRRPEMPT